jgi:hypothetical protein
MDFSAALLVILAILAVVLIGILIVAAVYLIRLVKLWSIVNDPRMPVQGKVAFWAAILYAVFPIDVLPDPIYLDDVGVMVAVISYIGNLARKNGVFAREPIVLPDATVPEPPRLEADRRSH